MNAKKSIETRLLKFYLLMSIISIGLFTSCYPEDTGTHQPPNFEIENDMIISIEDNSSLFSIDDTIIINSVVENTQTTIDGLTITLSDYYADEEPKEIWYRLKLLKESNFGDLVNIPINEEYIEFIEGTVSTAGRLIGITSTLNEGTFKSKFGIKLKEAGTYYLSARRSGGKIIISGGGYEKGLIHIYTKIINSEENGMYKFIVQ